MLRLALVVVVVAGACGGSDDPGTPYTPPPLTYDAAVVVRVGPKMPGATGLQFGADAYFLDYAGKARIPNGFNTVGHRASNCHKRDTEHCSLVTCTVVMDPSIDFDGANYVLAGMITVTRSTGPSLVMTPTVDNYYEGQMDNAAAPAAGETVKIEATGGTVPAFSAMIPLRNMLTQVTPAPAAEVTAPASKDLELAWTGGTAGNPVAVTIMNNPDMGDMASLKCSFDAASGHGAIPSELLGLLPEWSPGWTASFFDDSTKQMVGNWPVAIGALYEPTFGPSGFTLVVN